MPLPPLGFALRARLGENVIETSASFFGGKVGAKIGSWMDLYSRMIVGWRVEEHMEDTLIIHALKQGLYSRQPVSGLMAHSDRGGQYVSDEFRKLIKYFHIRQRMSRAEDPYDNAFAQSFWSRLKAAVLEGGAFLNVADARTEIFDYMEIYYNRVRRHSSLGYKSPLQFESDYYLNGQVNCKPKPDHLPELEDETSSNYFSYRS